jgi:UDP-2,3-diacylglucosamine pyrophosphatase LpxH
MILKALIIPDTHLPYEDKPAYNLMLKVGKILAPDEIVILGDYLDCLPVTAHPKDPDSDSLIVNEIDYANNKLDELDSLFPKAKKVFLFGNHEFRIERYIRDNAPALFGTIKLEKLLKLDKRKNWKHLDYNYHQSYKILNSYLYARHEPFGANPKACAQRAMTSIVYGHVHQIEEAQVASGTNRNLKHVAFCPGWLGNTKDKAFNYLKGNPNWSLGFGIVYVDSKTKQFSHQIIRIIDGKAFFNGKIIK